jgi:N-ethylmaleimide reductase
MSVSKLLSPVRVGPYDLRNRVVMAPMTRNRAGAGRAPTALNALYYAQRAGAGLIVSEATQVSAHGVGYPGTPGIHTDAQVAGWNLVTDAVHARGGRIFLQLWHCGRVSHPSLLPGGELPVSASAVAPNIQVSTPDGMKPAVAPRALALSEIPGVVAMYGHGAERAKEAGFDGVEIHAANGYLIDQFLRDGTNRRTDAYGGSPENRARFLLDVLDAVTAVWGADRVGVRLSPSGTFNDMHDSAPRATFGTAIRALAPKGLAYLHLVEPQPGDLRHGGVAVPAAEFRPLYPGVLMTNGGYTRDTAETVLAAGTADLVSFGQLFLANPDLPERFRRGVTLNPADPATFYGGDAKGYTDYPALAG